MIAVYFREVLILENINLILILRRRQFSNTSPLDWRTEFHHTDTSPLGEVNT